MDYSSEYTIAFKSEVSTADIPIFVHRHNVTGKDFLCIKKGYGKPCEICEDYSRKTK